MFRIKTVKPLKEYKLLVEFENNERRTCDISQFLNIGSFKELRNEELINQVRNEGYSVEWPNELDLSFNTLLSNLNIDAMIYELYFPDEIKAAEREILKHLNNLPELNDNQTDEQKLTIVENLCRELSNPSHPVSIAMKDT